MSATEAIGQPCCKYTGRKEHTLAFERVRTVLQVPGFKQELKHSDREYVTFAGVSLEGKAGLPTYRDDKGLNLVMYRSISQGPGECSRLPPISWGLSMSKLAQEQQRQPVWQVECKQGCCANPVRCLLCNS